MIALDGLYQRASPDAVKLREVLIEQDLLALKRFPPAKSAVYDAASKGLAKIIGNPGVGAELLARQAERVVGMVSLLFTIFTALGERVALLEDMSVSPERRGTDDGSNAFVADINSRYGAQSRGILGVVS